MEQTVQTVMCSHCRVRMVPVCGTHGRVQSFQCHGCMRWVSGTYAEMLESNARRSNEDEAERRRQFEQVKTRLDRWMARLDEEDPYALLGVSPFAPLDEIRSKYREKALEHHPDRGGCPEKMAALNRAFERVTQHHETKVRPALPAQGVARSWRPKAPPATQRVYRP